MPLAFSLLIDLIGFCTWAPSPSMNRCQTFTHTCRDGLLIKTALYFFLLRPSRLRTRHRSFPLYWCINNFCALIESLGLPMCVWGGWWMCACVSVTCISQINCCLVSHSIRVKTSLNSTPFDCLALFISFVPTNFFLLFTCNKSRWRPNEGLISKHTQIPTHAHTHTYIYIHRCTHLSTHYFRSPLRCYLYICPYVPLIPLLISLFGTFCVIDWLIQLAKQAAWKCSDDRRLLRWIQGLKSFKSTAKWIVFKFICKCETWKLLYKHFASSLTQIWARD